MVLQNTKTNTSVSLSSSAMLVELSTSAWSGWKRDKAQSDKVTSDAGAQRDSARVTKSIVDCAELKAVNRIRGEARNHVHYMLSLPGLDNGPRLLSTNLYFDYVEKMSEKEQEFNGAVAVFLDRYVQLVATQRDRLQGLFNEADYPHVDDLSKKFKFRIAYMPLPEAGDFRLDTKVDVQALKDEYEQACNDKLVEASNHLFEKLRGPLQNMVERLDFAPDDKKKVFKDTLVSNITKLVDVMRACNLTGDTRMSGIVNKIDDALSGVTVDALRNSDSLRAQTKESMQAALEILPSLDW